jgi:uncharacterized protein YqeY
MLTKQTLESDLREAMRARDEVRKRTLRMALSAVKLAEVDKRGALDEPALLNILRKEIKSREETLADAERAQRPDVTAGVKAEMAVLETYLPKSLSPEEIEGLARQAITETAATGPQDMGKVMKTLMPRIQGRADGKAVNDTVRRLLSGG